MNADNQSKQSTRFIAPHRNAFAVRPNLHAFVCAFLLCLLLAATGCVEHAIGRAEDVIAAPAAPAAAAADTGWPLFRGDPQSTGVARSTLPDQPALLWKQTFKDAAFEAGAIVVNGVVYVGSAGTD